VHVLDPGANKFEAKIRVIDGGDIQTAPLV
jgi:hypothetical protein